jgi:hypothetical protein
MTNATVGKVTQSTEGGVVHITYEDGQSEFTVGPEVPVLAYVAGDRSLLKPGSAVVTVAQKKSDVTLTTGRVTAEKNGVKRRFESSAGGNRIRTLGPRDGLPGVYIGPVCTGSSCRYGAGSDLYIHPMPR